MYNENEHSQHSPPQTTFYSSASYIVIVTFILLFSFSVLFITDWRSVGSVWLLGMDHLKNARVNRSI